MDQLINLVNTSIEEDLSQLGGSSAALAQKLVAARPFNSADDLLKIEGVTPELLETWQKEIAATVNNPAESGQNEITGGQTERKRKGGTGGVVARIILVLIILAALAAAAYFGIPFFRDNVLHPLESNTSRVGELAATQAAESERFLTELDGLHSEMAGLRGEIATLQARIDTAEGSIDSHGASLKELEKMQSTLRAEMNTQNSDLLSAMNEQLTITRALQLLSRSRLYLSQNNYGMARDDIASARDLLFPLLETIAPDLETGLRVVISRLDMALANLPAYPVVAVFDVDTAWQLLVDGLPAVPEPAVTPLVNSETPPPTPVITPTATP